MRIMCQLYRQSLRTVAALLLLCISCSFFSVSFGVWTTANATAEATEKGFTTIAIPSSRTEPMEVIATNGRVVTINRSVFTSEIKAYIEEASKTQEFVQGIYRQNYISAWSPSFQTLGSAEVEGQYNTNKDAPYDRAVFVVEITELGEPQWESYNETTAVDFVADIKETVALHSSYETREKLLVHCVFRSEQELLEADLQVGGRYLVYGSYSDKDLLLRTSLASYTRCSVEDISWDNLTLIEDPEEKSLFPHVKAWYSYGSGSKFSVNENEFQGINAGSLVVQNYGAGYAEDSYPQYIDGTVGTVSNRELNDTPTIVQLTSTVDEFLTDPVTEKWKHAIEELKIRYQCVPVLGTEFLESMYSFVVKDAYLVEGRFFTAEDYQGSRVCIIPESLAQKSGLLVGDTVELSFYWGGDPYMELGSDRFLSAQRYSYKTGFQEEAVSYQIVGIYRHMNAWGESSYSFHPNTVFVPGKSILGPSYIGEGGVYETIVLENGSIDEMQALMESQGYPEDILLYFDQGYEEIKGALQSFREMGNIQFAVAGVVWVAALVLYLVLFAQHQRMTAGLMLSLGAGKKKTGSFWWNICMTPAAVAVCIGLLSGIFLIEYFGGQIVTVSFGEGAGLSGSTIQQIENIKNTTVFSGWSILVTAVAQLSVFGVVFAVNILAQLEKMPLKLLKR